MIKNIVFDFGGVIAPLSREQAVKAFERIGLADANERLDQCHQQGIFQDLEEGRLTEGEFHKKLEELCHRSLTEEEIQSAWMGFFVGVNPEWLRELTALKEKGFRLLLLSNTNPYVMRWACSPSLSSDGKGLTDYFDKLYLSFQIGYTKPDARIFEYLLADSGILPQETLFIDDGKANADMGKKLGMLTLNPRNGEDWRKELNALLNAQ